MNLNFRDSRDDAALELLSREDDEREWRRDQGLAAADDLLDHCDQFADAIVADESCVASFCYSDPTIRVHGKRLAVADALIVSLTLPDEQAVVVRRDCYAAIREHLADQLEA